jgi:hypothetical protein
MNKIHRAAVLGILFLFCPKTAFTDEPFCPSDFRAVRRGDESSRSHGLRRISHLETISDEFSSPIIHAISQIIRYKQDMAEPASPDAVHPEMIAIKDGRFTHIEYSDEQLSMFFCFNDNQTLWAAAKTSSSPQNQIFPNFKAGRNNDSFIGMKDSPKIQYISSGDLRRLIQAVHFVSCRMNINFEFDKYSISFTPEVSFSQQNFFVMFKLHNHSGFDGLSPIVRFSLENEGRSIDKFWTA